MKTYTEYNKENNAWFNIDDMIEEANKIAMNGHRLRKNVKHFDEDFMTAMNKLAEDKGFYFTDNEWEEEVIDF